MTTYSGGESPGTVLENQNEQEDVMATEIIKTFTMAVKYTRNDEEAISPTDIAYMKMVAQLSKSIGELGNSSMGEIDAHIVDVVSVV